MPRPPIAVLALIMALSSIATVANADIQLAWRDSGYDLAAGYRYSIALQSGSVWTGTTALAATNAGPIRIELRGSALRVTINNNVAFNQDINQDAATVYITVTCDGSGNVEVSGYGNVGGFSIDRSYRIMVYTETVSAWPQSATSSVTISRQSLGCQPVNPSLTPIENPQLAAAFGAGAAAVAIIVIIVALGLLLILWLLGKAGGARNLIKSAVG